MSRFDYTFEQTESLEQLKRLILGNFETRGYRQIHLSAFESVETFVEQKGENVRQKIFTLNGDADAELCLRPELTVPACKFYLNSLADSLERCRICYEGLVWRMNPVEPGFYSEFTQAGVELIGDHAELGADAEILELAIDTLIRCGVKISKIVVNDVRILKHVFAELGIGHKRQSQIEQALIRGERIETLPIGQPASPEGSDLFEQVLESVGPDRLSEFMVEILSLQGNSYGPNSRTPKDVADRLIRKKTTEENELTQPQLDVLSELLNISGNVEQVSTQLKKLAKVNGFKEAQQFGELVDLLVDKTRLLQSTLSDEVSLNIEWNPSFQRSFKYYSGLIFDINSDNGAVCGGGRYDDLLTQIGAKRKLKAAGFAIGIDRLLSGQSQTTASNPSRKAVVALLPDCNPSPKAANEQGACYDSLQQCLRIAADLRRADWTVETDYSGADRDKIIHQAKQANLNLIVWFDANQSQTGMVTVMQPEENIDETIPVAKLPEFLNQWRLPAGGK